ncbi:site-2 protease family protein [Planococcus sp. SE5232]|uniref:site-2 protease family protein n=1 Tax=unclassified Planococcus (in: firmicutes) TaxID=2662419 RepID=UPI003D6C2318
MLFEVLTVLLMITTALFIHEMGHAIATIAQNKKAKAEIFLGSSSKEKKLKLNLGRITCYLTIALSGFCQPSNREELPPPTFKQRLVFLVGGPIASLFGFAALYFASHFFSGVTGTILINLAGANFFICATSLIPFTYPPFLGGGPSDGLQVLNLIKENRKQSKAVS